MDVTTVTNIHTKRPVTPSCNRFDTEVAPVWFGVQVLTALRCTLSARKSSRSLARSPAPPILTLRLEGRRVRPRAGPRRWPRPQKSARRRPRPCPCGSMRCRSAIPHLRSVSASTAPTARPQVMLCRKLSSQLSQRIIESSGLFGSRGLLGLRRVWVEVNGV